MSALPTLSPTLSRWLLLWKDSQGIHIYANHAAIYTLFQPEVKVVPGLQLRNIIKQDKDIDWNGKNISPLSGKVNQNNGLCVLTILVSAPEMMMMRLVCVSTSAVSELPYRESPNSIDVWLSTMIYPTRALLSAFSYREKFIVIRLKLQGISLSFIKFASNFHLCKKIFLNSPQKLIWDAKI